MSNEKVENVDGSVEEERIYKGDRENEISEEYEEGGR